MSTFVTYAWSGWRHGKSDAGLEFGFTENKLNSRDFGQGNAGGYELEVKALCKCGEGAYDESEGRNKRCAYYFCPSSAKTHLGTFMQTYIRNVRKGRWWCSAEIWRDHDFKNLIIRCLWRMRVKERLSTERATKKKKRQKPREGEMPTSKTEDGREAATPLVRAEKARTRKKPAGP